MKDKVDELVCKEFFIRNYMYNLYQSYVAHTGTNLSNTALSLHLRENGDTIN